MSRKPANLKSKTEAIERMLKGEMFYFGRGVLRYQEHSSPDTYHYTGIPFNNVSTDCWNNFKQWEIEVR